MIDCCICGYGDGCLFTVRECVHVCHGATKKQIIDRLNEGRYKNYRETMKKYLFDKFRVVYDDVGDVDEIYLADI
jgi:hypothetical protein